MPRITRLERRAIPLLLIIVLILVPAIACGGGSSAPATTPIQYETPTPGSSAVAGVGAPSAQATGQASPAEGASNVTLTAKDTKFSTDKITVPHGSQVTIAFTNDDQIFHNFALYPSKGAQKAIFTSDLVKGPSVTKQLTFAAPAAGTYYFQCDVHPDQMNGQFIVT